ncbi:MAG: choice-of-anchor D domain-containing protein [Gemmatimonadota bacterium]|nr:choice-of-anchor D domain-containing protein [Gemmatimonadota bacterium]
MLVADREGIVRHIGRGASGLSAAAASIRELLTLPPPTIRLPSTSLDFGEDVPAGEARTVTLVVRNTGGKDLSITNLESDLEGVTFSLTELTVAPGERATVDITFTPAKSGPFSGTITISSDDPENSSVTVSFSGTAAIIKPPTISIANTSLNFGEDVPAGESKTVTLVVKNTGEKDLSITNVESDLEGVTFSLTELTVAPGDSATVDITLTPAEGGPFSGTITISSDDPENSSVTVALSGTAIVVPVNPRADFDNDGEIGFSDFLAFARAFSTDNPTFDLDGSGTVDFPDFLEFARNFGKSVP